MKNRLCTGLYALLASMLFCVTTLVGCSSNPAASVPSADQLSSSNTSIIISEVMSSNDIFFPAADGRCYDWVELRNLTGNSYDLSSCYLTDDERTPHKFRLNGIVLEPYGYAVIYLSGLNGADVNGYLHADFKLSSTGETLILNDSSGAVMSMINIPASQPNVSYGYPLSGTEFAEDSGVWFSDPTPGGPNSENYAAEYVDLVYSTNGVIINEYMTDNSFIIYDADGDYSDWVELHNPTDTEADMSGYFLTDDPAAIGKWRFPDGTSIPAGGYLLVFCDGKNTTDAQGYLHASFSLGGDDLSIILSNPQGALSSQTNIAPLPENISCGLPAGTLEWKLFARPTPGAANTTVSFELTSQPAPDVNDGILISETLAASAGSGEYTTDFVEIYNATSGAVELGGYTLSQAPGEVAFTFPDITLGAGDYLLVYCDGTTADQAGAELHAPFKLNVGGESVYLANSEGRVVDHLRTGKQIYGVSCGRVGSDVSVRRFFSSPTPGAANSGTWYAAYAPQPAFSQSGGYTSGGTEIYITVPEGCQVRYTTNGYEPDSSSKLYTEGTPIIIDSTTVLKAIAYKDECLPSQMTAATYLVEEPHSIAVVSMSGFGLTDNENGILVEGYNENYRQDWVRKVHIEYYDQNGSLGVEFSAGAEIFGQYSRSMDKKGVRLNISEQYGASEVTYPFFPDSVTGVSTFKSLLLRPSGQDQTYTMLRDEVVPAIIRGSMEIDYQEFQACALYVNGEYWGLYYIRERLDEDYIVSKYGYTKGNIDLVKSQTFVQAGSIDAYKELESFARNNDLTIQENYEYMASLVDFESLCDFWISETFFSNTDTGNIRCHRSEDGKWRWMTYDYDWSMFSTTYKRDFIYQHCLERSGHGSADFSNAIIRKLLENDQFHDLFISRYCYHLNTTFDPDRCVAILDQMADTIRDEVPRNAEKWGTPKPENWEKSVDFLRSFFTVKHDLIKEQLMDNFDLSQQELNRYLKENK